MNHPHYDPATASAHSGSGTADATRARLAAAFALPFGPVREQRITESVLELITAEISARHPAITTVLFDWAPYGGLGVAGFHDRHGNPVADPDLDLDITHYASDIRATADTALTPTRSGEPGLFRLDLTTATTSATTPPGLVAAHTLRAGQRLDHGKQVHAVTRREDHLDIAFDDGTWWCDVPAQHPITLWDGNPSTRCYPFAFLAADEYRIYRHETDHNPTHRPRAPGDEKPPTRTPGVGVRARCRTA
jgi:hypothetical protein